MTRRQGEKIVRTYQNGASSLSAADRHILAYPNDMLVPARLSQQEDGFTLTFDTAGLDSLAALVRLEGSDQYRALANAAGLEGLCGEYSFSLDPDNLLLDINLNAKVLERDGAPGGGGSFLAQYKALVGAVLMPQYPFEDFLQPKGELFAKKDILRRVFRAETAGEISSMLLELAREERDDRLNNYVQVKKGRARAGRFIAAALAVLAALGVGFSGYYLFYYIPVSGAIISGSYHYERGNYLEAEDAMAGLSLDAMPPESKLILARSYVMTEVADMAARQEFLNKLTVSADERLYCFWIEYGRRNRTRAIDYAVQLGDSRLRSMAEGIQAGAD
jgi:uncharacterized membrane protein YukC